MFKVSDKFNKEINKLQGRKFNAKVIIRDKEYSGNQIYEMNLEESVNPSDSFSIGSICSNSFDIKLINTGDIFDNAIVKPYVGLYIGDDIEYIPLGVFNVIKTSVKGKFINLECVDNMLGLEKVYFSDLSYPADINDIAKEICKKASVNLASKLPNYRVNKIEGYSLREAIGFIASLCGSFARFNRIGDLEIRGYEVVKQEMTPHNLFKLDIEANECIVKKVIAKKGQEELSFGTDDGNKIVFNNPIITREILSDIYTKYNGFKYITYTAKWKGNPAIMAGDILNLTDLKGNKYNALIMEQKFTYKNGISSEVKAKGKTRQDSSFDSKGSVTQSMERYSIEQANIKKALIDKASINDLTAVDAKIHRLYTDDLTAIRADIVNLNSKKANIIELNSVRADLKNAIIGKANITDLNAAVGKINVLESKTASIENALNKNLTAENIATGAITAGSGIIAEGAIGDAQISSLNANKMRAGTLDTSLVTVAGPNGRLKILGNRLQIFDDVNNRLFERIMLGINDKNRASLTLRGADGQTVLLTEEGLTKSGITDGFGKADDNSLSALKLDKNSIVRQVNGSTETIAGTRIQVGDRTLDVELSTQKNTLTEHSKELSSQKATIKALDNAIKLKVDSQTFSKATETISGNINKAKQDAINTASTDATNKANNALNSAKAFVNTEINTVNTHLNKNTSEINILKGKIESKVSQSDLDKSIANIIIGGRNLVDYASSGGGNTKLDKEGNITFLGEVKDTYFSLTLYEDLVEGETYTLSLNAENVPEDCNWIFGIQKQTNKYQIKINKNGRLSATFVAIKTDNMRRVLVDDISNAISGVKIKLSNFKIEKGNKATDYTVAPEKTYKLVADNIKIVTDKITTVESKLTQENNSIKASVQDLNSTTQTITTSVSNLNRDLTSKINSNLDVAKSFAISKANEALNSAKAFVNAEINTVNSKVHNVESNLNILSDKINTKVSQTDIDKSISAIQVGGRNYLTNSIINKTNSDYRIASIYFGNEKPKDGEEFTISIKGELGKGKRAFGVYNSGGNVSLVSLDKRDSNGIYRGTFNWIVASTNNTHINIYTIDSSTVVDSTIEWVKLEKGNKVSSSWTPAPEDTDKAIADNIKVVDTKISDVSSSVTQLRDSVTTQINSINSKTHSIETTLNGKASKQEVTEVNNRVTTIKANLDGITQRVSATESKTQTLENNLNGKASKQEVVNITSRIATVETNLSGITSRVSSTETVTKSLNDKLWEATNKLNNVEQRITPISIINTVSSAYYKKGEVDNVFSTKSEVEQLDNRINYKFSNTGYSNLIFNGNFANGTVHWRNWGNCSLVSENGQLTVRAKQSSNNANIGAVSSAFVLEKGKKYSLTFQGCSSWNIPWLNYIYLLGEDGVNHRLDLRIDINSADLVYRTATFPAPATKWVRLLIGVEGYLQTDVSGFKLVDVCLVEGDIPRRFVPNANEISEGATSIDSNGVIVRHTNGSYTSMTLGGFEWKTKGMSKAYHCLAETGWVNISTGAWLGDHYDIKITLPEYFRGKVFTPCSMIQGWYVESNFSLNQLVVNIPYETINYSEGSFVIRVKALTRDGVFQRNINISWLAIA